MLTGTPEQIAADLAKGIDTAWVLLASAFVFFMQAGFALLESGSVRKKNSQNILIKNMIDACIATIAFWVLGYGLAFGSPAVNGGGFIGTHKFVGVYDDWSDNLYFSFQFAFCATAATIVSGSLAERT